jgi:hypothetical protein
MKASIAVSTVSPPPEAPARAPLSWDLKNITIRPQQRTLLASEKCLRELKSLKVFYLRGRGAKKSVASRFDKLRISF